VLAVRGLVEEVDHGVEPGDEPEVGGEAEGVAGELVVAQQLGQ
jgi:hypothetical protein